jgi:trans-aconitate methyltransferase
MRDLNFAQLDNAEHIAPFSTFLRVLETLVARDDLARPARLLDVGCGSGHYSQLIERYAPGRFVYAGCDSSTQMIEIARAEWPERTFSVGDVFDEALDLDAFDVLLASALVDVSRKWPRALGILFASAASHVILHRQHVTAESSRVEVVRGYAGHDTYRSFINVADLEAMASRYGREIAEVFRVEGDIHSFLVSRSP